MLESRDGYVYELVVAQTRDRLVKYARYLCRSDQSLADDIVQEAMISAWKAWPRWSPRYPDNVDESVYKWMKAIVSNKFVSCTRTPYYREMEAVGRLINQPMPRNVFPSSGEFLPLGDLIDNREVCFFDLNHYQNDKQVPDNLFGDDVELALSRLPEDQSIVIRMYYESGMTTREIGQTLGISRATASTRLCRGLAKIRPMLSTYALETYGLRGPGVQSSDVEATKIAESDTN